MSCLMSVSISSPLWQSSPWATTSAPNRGMTLWIQQFWAMFLKRFYNSLRFFGAVFSQFLLPMLFVLFALVLAVTIPNPNQDDPRRALLLENSALSSNVTVFYVEFADEQNSPLNFSVSQIHTIICSWSGRMAW